MSQDQRIGDRADHFWDVCERVTTHETKFTDREVEFAESMKERLNDYGAQTYVSVKQINWLNDLEQKLRDQGL